MSTALTPTLSAAKLGLLLLLLAQSPAAAQSVGASEKPELPSDPRAWLNSTPLSVDMLKGKAAVLWYFEEDCPRCRERWPAMLSEARKFQGKPVVFIGVNSGNPPAEVLRYVRENNIDWPVIVDPSRQFEKQSNVGEISLTNIYQMRLLAADGEMRPAGTIDIATAANAVLQEAAWKVDPASVPASLLPAWKAIEFGDHAKGAVLVKKSLNSRDDETRAAAEKLQAAAAADWNELAKSAEIAMTAGRGWDAYKLYAQIATQFKGYDLPPQFESARNDLEKSPQIKRQFDAIKRFEAATRTPPSSNSARQRLISTLNLLIKDYPDTEAAQKAQGLLTQMNAD